MATGVAFDVLENAFLEHIMLGAAYAQPTDIFIGLSTTQPNDDGTGISEPIGNGYTEISFTTWNAAAARVATNNGIISFPQASGGNWGTISHFFVRKDTIDSGPLMFWGNLDTPTAVNDGDTLEIGDAQLNLTWVSGGANNFTANGFLDHILMNTPFAQPAQNWLAMSTSNPTDTGSGLAEPANGYARQQITNWTAASGGSKGNNEVITFPEATGNWGIITHFQLMDAVTGGNHLYYGPTPNKSVSTNQTARWGLGQLIKTLD